MAWGDFVLEGICPFNKETGIEMSLMYYGITGYSSNI